MRQLRQFVSMHFFSYSTCMYLCMEKYSELLKTVQLFNCTDNIFFFGKKEACFKLI